MDRFLERIFMQGSKSAGIAADRLVCLGSVVMDPFMPYARDGDFFKTIMQQIDEALSQLVVDWRRQHR